MSISRLQVPPIRLSFLLLILGTLSLRAEPVTLTRTPNGGIQPQVATDEDGNVHLVYYLGDPRSGELFYMRHRAGQGAFSTPILVNTPTSRAMAMGTIRGAQLAVGKIGRVHVAWNGGDGSETTNHPGAPMLYTRLNRDGRTFDAPRDLTTKTTGLDGGGCVAADRVGNVYVAWHGREPGSVDGEAGRAVYVARSTDDGSTFAPEQKALSYETGACGCCGMRAYADRKGRVYLLFRAAADLTNRAEVLLGSRPGGLQFDQLNRDLWTTPSCPMSSAFLGEGHGSVLAAWETGGKVWYTAIDDASARVSTPVCPTQARQAKFPVAVQNRHGEILLVWTEGTAWEKGGAVAWQLYDAERRPLSERGRTLGVPVWSMATAYAKPDGSFVILY
jgi:hypothetical protein